MDVAVTVHLPFAEAGNVLWPYLRPQVPAGIGTNILPISKRIEAAARHSAKDGVGNRGGRADSHVAQYAVGVGFTQGSIQRWEMKPARDSPISGPV